MSDTPWSPEDTAGKIAKRQTVTRYEGDLELARSVVAGSRSAWQSFAERYSGLIHSIIRRHLHSRDGDEVDTVFVAVLDGLYRHKLATYEGRAALSTWLTLVVRTEVFDHLRRRFGRHEVPGTLGPLLEAEREIFQLHFVEGCDVREIVKRLEADWTGWTSSRVLTAIGRMEQRLDGRWLRRMAYDLHARTVGIASGRLLEYLDHLRGEIQFQNGHGPEFELMEREAQRTTASVKELVALLPAEDQRLLAMRFENGWSAKKIAAELGNGSARAVYTALNRIVRGLRRALKRQGVTNG
jgi:DNA-directed RNA polymerase specialized sigma24 family protein